MLVVAEVFRVSSCCALLCYCFFCSCCFLSCLCRALCGFLTKENFCLLRMSLVVVLSDHFCSGKQVGKGCKFHKQLKKCIHIRYDGGCSDKVLPT